jgi:hypothetical protein
MTLNRRSTKLMIHCTLILVTFEIINFNFFQSIYPHFKCRSANFRKVMNCLFSRPKMVTWFGEEYEEEIFLCGMKIQWWAFSFLSSSLTWISLNCCAIDLIVTAKMRHFATKRQLLTCCRVRWVYTNSPWISLKSSSYWRNLDLKLDFFVQKLTKNSPKSCVKSSEKTTLPLEFFFSGKTKIEILDQAFRIQEKWNWRTKWEKNENKHEIYKKYSNVRI